MRLSTNLNVMTKAIDKATNFMSRDFVELENLQTNPISAAKFANSCYLKIKEKMIDDLSKFRLNCNLIFPDGKNYIANSDPEYSYIINPLDGLYNFSRSIPYFAVSIALEYKNSNGVKEIIAAVINNVISNELYLSEKGFGSYLNNRRIRVSRRGNSDNINLVVQNYSILKESNLNLDKFKNLEIRNLGCDSLMIAYLASCRAEMALFTNNNLQFSSSLFLLAKEAGGAIIEKDGHIILTNHQINL
jgi:myo-inositol-1(or 4)-monophosphatase